MFAVFDVGGTYTRVAVGDNQKIISDIVISPTPMEFDKGLSLIVDVVRTLSQGKKIRAAVGGLAGILDCDHTMVTYGLWEKKSIKKILEHELQMPVYLENDAALAGLGEAVMGAGKDYMIVGYITVSTDVGGARITHKKIDPGVFGFEPGHQIVDASLSLCKRCTSHTLSAHISGKSIEEHYGCKAEEITDATIWEGVASALAVGLVNTIVHWSPDIMVLGGSVMKRISIERVRTLVGQLLPIYPELPHIERAQLGHVSGLQGALQIARVIF